jgi:hypothetical protein
MSRRTALVAAVLLVLGLAPSAYADGDPASDVLLGQNVFPPYETMSRTLEDQVYAIGTASASAGYPLKIALIATKVDLGVLPARLLRRPELYARFLSTELTGVFNGPVLVVTPYGFGLATQGRALSLAALRGVAIGAGTSGIAHAAIAATRALAAAAGHALPGDVASVSPSNGASSATIDSSLEVLLVLFLLALAAMVVALTERTRRALG